MVTPISKGKLHDYRSRRDFTKSREPSGGKPDHRDRPRFVIQKHDASTLHYDFRLEIGDVLVSWAIPKGLSTDPRDKRLAIQTEDHPLDYIDFEGVIPKSQYGGGTVLVWDTGTYRNLRADKGKDSKEMAASLETGLIEVWLEGEKLNGGYALTRMRSGEQPQWLVIKMKDAGADARRRPITTQPKSVKTGRDLEAVAQKERDTGDSREP